MLFFKNNCILLMLVWIYIFDCIIVLNFISCQLTFLRIKKC